MAQVAKERLDQLQDPELSIEQAMTDYKRLGYSDSWINQHHVARVLLRPPRRKVHRRV
jgi:hypothetical protein